MDGSDKQIGLRIKELERLYGIKNGGNRGNQYVEAERNNFVLAKTQEDLAAQLDIDVRTLRNYKLLTEMIPELERIYGIQNGGDRKSEETKSDPNYSELIKCRVF